MLEPAIVPFARRLAEENNVDWRALQGSGADGSIVESDVLHYLSQVMLGRAPLNPTLEPLPEGLDAWPEGLQRTDSIAAPIAAPAEASEIWVFELPTEAQAPQPEADSFGAPITQATGFFAPAAPLRETSEGALQEALERERTEHQAARRQATLLRESLQAQELELQQFGKLKEEVRELTRALEQAQAAAADKRELEAQNRDLSARLERARAFKERAKTEVARLQALNEELKGELQGLKKRPRWKVLGK